MNPDLQVQIAGFLNSKVAETTKRSWSVGHAAVFLTPDSAKRAQPLPSLFQHGSTSQCLQFTRQQPPPPWQPPWPSWRACPSGVHSCARCGAWHTPWRPVVMGQVCKFSANKIYSQLPGLVSGNMVWYIVALVPVAVCIFPGVSEEWCGNALYP